MRPRVRFRFVAAVVLIGVLGPRVALAQRPDSASQKPTTRADLVRMVRADDSLGRRDEAYRIRTRLRDGDFEVGDRIIATFEGLGVPKPTDTLLIVQAGRNVRLAEPMGDLNLTGVLRSEIKDSIERRALRYYRNVTVHVTPLLRLSVSGAVKVAGFYYERPDTPLSDFIMRTGGQDQTADLGKVEIKRGERVVWHKEDVATALADGMTLDQLGVEPGDELVVGTRTSNRWITVLQIGVPIMTAILFQVFYRRR
jgi:hypothetical protein